MFSTQFKRTFLQNARQFRFASTYTLITPSTPRPRVALVELNRPKALNALSSALIAELNSHLQSLDKDSEIGAVVLTGGEKVFAGRSIG
jgi:enoyl-CoA hydratase